MAMQDLTRCSRASPYSERNTSDPYPVQSRVEAAVFEFFDKVRFDKLFRFRIGDLGRGRRHKIH